MTIILLAAVLPVLATGAGPEAGATVLTTPHVEYRMNEAAATRSPWIDANGWVILRKPQARYYYDASGAAAALSAAEAFAYSAEARIHTDAAGAGAFRGMLEFLRRLPDSDLPAVADIGVVDDGSDETGELMNLLTRHNLLYRIVTAPNEKLKINVRIGSNEYPKSEAEDPGFLAQKIRGALGDENRSLRIYGSEVVIGRLLGNGRTARVHLLNYSGRPVKGLRVRVSGEYRRQKLFTYSEPSSSVMDPVVASGATEFTIPSLPVYAVIDLSE
jgi:hypothetical protein